MHHTSVTYSQKMYGEKNNIKRSLTGSEIEMRCTHDARPDDHCRKRKPRPHKMKKPYQYRKRKPHRRKTSTQELNQYACIRPSDYPTPAKNGNPIRNQLINKRSEHNRLFTSTKEDGRVTIESHHRQSTLKALAHFFRR